MQGTMQLLGGRPQGDQQGQGGGNNYQQSAPRQQAPRPAPQQQPQRPAPQQAAAQPAPDFDSFDDDIPF
ncbi:single-stranded DNA-binding protein [compost metagenome]